MLKIRVDRLKQHPRNQKEQKIQTNKRTSLKPGRDKPISDVKGSVGIEETVNTEV